MNRDCSVTVLIGLTSTRDKRAPAGSSPYSPRSLNIHTSSNRFLVIFYYYYFITHGSKDRFTVVFRKDVSRIQN